MAEKLIDNNLWRSDLAAVSDSLPELDELAGKSVLISGAGGLICSALVDLLIAYNASNSVRIDVIAAGRSEARIRSRFGSGCQFVEYDALRPEPFAFSADYIIHGAGNAHPAAMSAEPVETIQENIFGVNALLPCARKRFLYISSSEVYGQRAESNSRPFTENDYGYVDLLNVRNCYAMGKRSAETLCVSYASEYGSNAVIVRPGHIYGPTASERDSRVSSAFAYSAARGEDIVMKSEGLQLRSWCYCIDCAGAILKVLLRGERCGAYNIPGEILTIRQMAELLAEFGGVRVLREGASQSEVKAFNPMNNSSVDGTKLETLGWRNIFDARTGLEHTLEILRNML